jgi:hypothetical protein
MDIAGGSNATTVHVGLRSLDGNALTVRVWNGRSWANLVSNLYSRTEAYFDVTAAVKAAGGKLYIKVTAGTASLVNIKAVGGSKPTVSTRMIMDALEIFKTGGETPILDEGMKISHSLNLSADISLNYAVLAGALEGAESSYMTVEIPVYEGNEIVDSRVVTLEPVQRDYYYYYTLDGLTAVNMNDVLKAELHYFKDGRDYVSATDAYSIAQYAYIQLDKETNSESIKTLCANLLRYGAEAQLFKGYRTDALADSAMTEIHLGYLGDLAAVTFGTLNTVDNDVETPTVTWVGKTLNLESRISLVFVVDPAAYEGDPEELSLRVTYEDRDGQTQMREIGESEAYNVSYIAFTFSDLLAAELRTPLSVAVYAGEEQVSPTLHYGADAYANGKTGQLEILCRALFAYVDAAEAFFA